jgi:glycine betaine/choline ABC-type transport system substrate-binding protein
MTSGIPSNNVVVSQPEGCERHIICGMYKQTISSRSGFRLFFIPVIAGAAVCL